MNVETFEFNSAVCRICSYPAKHRQRRFWLTVRYLQCPVDTSQARRRHRCGVHGSCYAAGLTFTSCSSTAGSCTISGGGASLNLGTLANGNAVVITIQATLSTTVTDGATLANTPSVTSGTPDPDTSNNSGSAGSATITVENKSDLLVTTRSSLTVVNFGGTLVYTVTVTNQGPFQASAVTLVDPIPAPVDISIDELRRGLLYGSTTSTGRNRYVQLWEHGQRSLGDSELHGAGFDPAGSGVDHEHRGRQFAQLRSEPGQQLRKCNNVGLWQQTLVENHNRHRPTPWKGVGSRCACAP